MGDCLTLNRHTDRATEDWVGRFDRMGIVSGSRSSAISIDGVVHVHQINDALLRTSTAARCTLPALLPALLPAMLPAMHAQLIVRCVMVTSPHTPPPYTSWDPLPLPLPLCVCDGA